MLYVSSQYNKLPHLYLLFRLKAEKNELQKEIQSIPKIQERFQEINQKMGNLTSEIKSIQQQIPSLKKSLQVAVKRKEDDKDLNRSIIDIMLAELASLKSCNDEIQRLTNELSKLDELKLSQTMQNYEMSLQNVNEQLTKNVSFSWNTLSQLEQMEAARLG